MNAEQKKQITDIMERHGVIVGYFFGSAQRGTMGPYSDIDVGVFFDENKVPEDKQFDAKMEISSEIGSAFKINQVDVINLLTTTDPLIKYVAVFSGELILQKNKEERFALETKIVRDYENTRELRRIARIVMKKQLMDGSFGRYQKIT